VLVEATGTFVKMREDLARRLFAEALARDAAAR
jgi:hypothetical protein